MLTYKKIVQSGVMTPSMASLLLTDDPATQKKILSGSEWVERLYRICLFYRSLVQAYVIGEAIWKDMTVDQLGYSDRLCRDIKNCWPLKEGTPAAKNEKEVFSFLNDAEAFLEPDSEQILEELKGLYNKYTDDSDRNSDIIGDADYLEVLRSFYLLAVTEVDLKTMKFSFPSDLHDAYSERFCIGCSPFVYFARKCGVSDGVMENFTAEGLALVCARKGEKNGELLFDLTEFHLRRDGSAHPYRTIRRQAPKDEKLYQICRALDMDTEWYEMDDYLCNMAFLVRITEVTKTVLKKFWKKSSDPVLQAPSGNVAKKLRLMLCGDADMCQSIERSGKITMENIDRVLYGLYIEFGVFKTMRELLRDTRREAYGQALFEEYMDCFVQMSREGKGGISAEQRIAYENECRQNIDSRLTKLSGIVPEKLPRFGKRMRAITAEWRAYYILKAAGIHADNLFADEESLLSIDDYFCMIKNPSTTLLADLNNVLSLLIELYGALMAGGADFEERAFRESVLRIRRENRGRDTLELFEYLQQLVELSQDHEVIKRVLGRDAICDAEKLEDMASNVKACFAIEQDFEPSEVQSRKGVFISYAHANKQVVHEYVKELKRAGIRVFLDAEQFLADDDWSERAQSELRSDDCVAVVSFMSRDAGISKAVRFELEEAKAYHKNILVFNLEKENVGEYLKDLEHNALPDKRQYASGIRDMLPDTKMHIQDVHELRKRVEELVFSGDEDNFIEKRSYNRFELAVANFYAFLKFSDGDINENVKFDWADEDEIDNVFHDDTYDVSRCIYPLVTSVKETKVKRDNIALMGYEILRDKGEDKRGMNYIFSSNRLSPDDYYCIPNYRTTGEDGMWMVNPLMISHRLFRAESQEES